MTTIKTDKHDFSHILKAPAAATLEAIYGPELAAAQLQLEHEAYTLGEARFLNNWNVRFRMVRLLIT